MAHLYHKIIFAILRRSIKNNPYIGEDDGSGIYSYTKGDYSICYRVSGREAGKICIEWISHKRRISGYGRKVRKIRKGFIDFWLYQKWLVFFRPSILFLLIVSLSLFYYGMIEKQATRMARLKWTIASVIGVSPEDVQYIGKGWLEISGQRRRIEERINEPPQYVYEPIKYAFNPLRWLLSADTGFIKRWRSESSGGYAKHRVVYNERGDIWLKKQNTWEHGSISGENIKWDVPQVTGMSVRKTPGHEINIQDKKLMIIDK